MFKAEDGWENVMENPNTRETAKETSAANPEESMKVALAECWPGGPIVSNPADCKDLDRDGWRVHKNILPDLKISNIEDLKQKGT